METPFGAPGRQKFAVNRSFLNVDDRHSVRRFGHLSLETRAVAGVPIGVQLLIRPLNSARLFSEALPPRRRGATFVMG